MKNFFSFFSVVLVFLIVLLVQQSRLFDVVGITPNLFLIALLLYAYYGTPSFFVGISISLLLTLFLFFMFPFFLVWGIGILFLFLLGIFFRGKITGNRFVDFLIMIIVDTVFFAVFLDIVFNVRTFGVDFNNFSFIFYSKLFFETVYNILVGVFGWIFLTKVFPSRKRIS